MPSWPKTGQHPGHAGELVSDFAAGLGWVAFAVRWGLAFARASGARNALPAELCWLTFTQFTPPLGGRRQLSPILVFTILHDFAILI